MTFAHVLTYLANPSMLSSLAQMAGKEKEGDSTRLLYTLVPIVREKEMLLVKECSDRLGEFGLTLWVVSTNQTPKNCNILNDI